MELVIVPVYDRRHPAHRPAVPHRQEELGVGPKGVTPDGLFSVEEVECIGACCWAPAIQVNYNFHDELKPDLVPGILDQYRNPTQDKEKNA